MQRPLYRKEKKLAADMQFLFHCKTKSTVVCDNLEGIMGCDYTYLIISISEIYVQNLQVQEKLQEIAHPGQRSAGQKLAYELVYSSEPEFTHKILHRRLLGSSYILIQCYKRNGLKISLQVHKYIYHILLT
jgi:hypothetical protein